MRKSLSSCSARARSQKQQEEASRNTAPDARERIPTGAGDVPRSYHSYSVYERFNSNRNKGLRVSSFLERFLDRSDDELSMQVRDLQTSY